MCDPTIKQVSLDFRIIRDFKGNLQDFTPSSLLMSRAFGYFTVYFHIYEESEKKRTASFRRIYHNDSERF